ncbi:hypothetical protein [Phytomonospora endophytica]|uniref:Uncharacterized protein n=1 Tax=Phytomonospora endophytica TaxID=714109 RepID=A0A841FYI8_9ACTN|nr:hypothetical protein [Phytomonospora endophytica]MBB6037030.1 hypothetical protein [Phytomonospora endophytica]GIG69426.1 hypothetical protein Pen01_57210 [Phytomonospora endophytica]
MTRDLRATLVAETDLAYTQLRLHLHDPWAGYCPTCNVPGPCALYTHLLDRLAVLENAELQLPDHEDEGNNTAGTEEAAP